MAKTWMLNIAEAKREGITPKDMEGAAAGIAKGVKHNLAGLRREKASELITLSEIRAQLSGKASMGTDEIPGEVILEKQKLAKATLDRIEEQLAFWKSEAARAKSLRIDAANLRRRLALRAAAQKVRTKKALRRPYAGAPKRRR